MADKGDVQRLSEGKVKKGGISAKPSTPKPNIKPSGQKPAQSKTK